jgi:hypothetical protein
MTAHLVPSLTPPLAGLRGRGRDLRGPETTAVNGQPAASVTFNRRDVGGVPAGFGTDVLAPAEASEGSGREEPEHLPAPPAAYLKEEVEQRAKQDGISVNQFVATAFAEKRGR